MTDFYLATFCASVVSWTLKNVCLYEHPDTNFDTLFSGSALSALSHVCKTSYVTLKFIRYYSQHSCLIITTNMAKWLRSDFGQDEVHRTIVWRNKHIIRNSRLDKIHQTNSSPTSLCRFYWQFLRSSNSLLLIDFVYQVWHSLYIQV